MGHLQHARRTALRNIARSLAVSIQAASFSLTLTPRKINDTKILFDFSFVTRKAAPDRTARCPRKFSFLSALYSLGFRMFSSFTMSAANARMPSESFSVAIASSFSA
jgi:hypothetical protein